MSVDFTTPWKFPQDFPANTIRLEAFPTWRSLSNLRQKKDKIRKASFAAEFNLYYVTRLININDEKPANREKEGKSHANLL